VKRVAALLSAVLVACGCSSWEAVDELPVVDTSRLNLEDADGLRNPSEDDGIGGVWRVVSDRFEPSQPLDLTVSEVETPAAESQEPEPTPVQPALRPAPEPMPKLAIPRRRDPSKVKPRGTKLTKSPEQVSREHYLTNPTTIEAQRITLYVPPAYLPEVRLTGADVKDLAPNRRRATGDARLVCRELTLKADQITLRTLKADQRDIRITARGDAGIISKVREQILRDEGLRSLLITNDKLIPLR